MIRVRPDLDERLPDSVHCRAIAAVGRFASREGDIAERHDDYLADAFGPVIFDDTSAFSTGVTPCQRPGPA